MKCKFCDYTAKVGFKQLLIDRIVCPKCKKVIFKDLKREFRNDNEIQKLWK